MRPLPAIIDGRRNVVTRFYQDHHKKEWYIQASEYLKQRRAFVQKRFVECMRYVDIFSENSETFSYEFAGILRDGCAHTTKGRRSSFPAAIVFWEGH